MQNIAPYELDPNFAIIYSYLKTFGKHIGEDYTDISIESFKEFLEAKKVEQDNIFLRLHCKLIRKLGETHFTNADWEKGIRLFAQDFPDGDDKLVKEKGYVNLPVEVKLRILKNLLEDQFEFNDGFNRAINEAFLGEEDAGTIRNNPLGRDRQGRSYWVIMDHLGCLRLYRGCKNDKTGADTWELVCKDGDDLANLIEDLDKDVQEWPPPQKPTVSKVKAETECQEKTSIEEPAVGAKADFITSTIKTEASTKDNADIDSNNDVEAEGKSASGDVAATMEGSKGAVNPEAPTIPDLDFQSIADDVAEAVHASSQYYRVPSPRSWEEVEQAERAHNLQHCVVTVKPLTDSEWAQHIETLNKRRTRHRDNMNDNHAEESNNPVKENNIMRDTYSDPESCDKETEEPLDKFKSKTKASDLNATEDSGRATVTEEGNVTDTEQENDPDETSSPLGSDYNPEPQQASGSKELMPGEDSRSSDSGDAGTDNESWEEISVPGDRSTDDFEVEDSRSETTQQETFTNYKSSLTSGIQYDTSVDKAQLKHCTVELKKTKANSFCKGPKFSENVKDAGSDVRLMECIVKLKKIDNNDSSETTQTLSTPKKKLHKNKLKEPNVELEKLANNENEKISSNLETRTDKVEGCGVETHSCSQGSPTKPLRQTSQVLVNDILQAKLKPCVVELEKLSPYKLKASLAKSSASILDIKKPVLKPCTVELGKLELECPLRATEGEFERVDEVDGSGLKIVDNGNVKKKSNVTNVSRNGHKVYRTFMTDAYTNKGKALSNVDSPGKSKYVCKLDAAAGKTNKEIVGVENVVLYPCTVKLDKLKLTGDIEDLSKSILEDKVCSSYDITKEVEDGEILTTAPDNVSDKTVGKSVPVTVHDTNSDKHKVSSKDQTKFTDFEESALNVCEVSKNKTATIEKSPSQTETLSSNGFPDTSLQNQLENKLKQAKEGSVEPLCPLVEQFTEKDIIHSNIVDEREPNADLKMDKNISINVKSFRETPTMLSIKTGEQANENSPKIIVDNCNNNADLHNEEACGEVDDENDSVISDLVCTSPRDSGNGSADTDQQNIDNALKDLLTLEEIIKHGTDIDDPASGFVLSDAEERNKTTKDIILDSNSGNAESLDITSEPSSDRSSKDITGTKTDDTVNAVEDSNSTCNSNCLSEDLSDNTKKIDKQNNQKDITGTKTEGAVNAVDNSNSTCNSLSEDVSDNIKKSGLDLETNGDQVNVSETDDLNRQDEEESMILQCSAIDERESDIDDCDESAVDVVHETESQHSVDNDDVVKSGVDSDSSDCQEIEIEKEKEEVIVIDDDSLDSFKDTVYHNTQKQSDYIRNALKESQKDHHYEWDIEKKSPKKKSSEAKAKVKRKSPKKFVKKRKGNKATTKDEMSIMVDGELVKIQHVTDSESDVDIVTVSDTEAKSLDENSTEFCKESTQVNTMTVETPEKSEDKDALLKFYMSAETASTKNATESCPSAVSSSQGIRRSCSVSTMTSHLNTTVPVATTESTSAPFIYISDSPTKDACEIPAAFGKESNKPDTSSFKPGGWPLLNHLPRKSSAMVGFPRPSTVAGTRFEPIRPVFQPRSMMSPRPLYSGSVSSQMSTAPMSFNTFPSPKSSFINIPSNSMPFPGLRMFTQPISSPVTTASAGAVSMPIRPSNVRQQFSFGNPIMQSLHQRPRVIYNQSIIGNIAGSNPSFRGANPTVYNNQSLPGQFTDCNQMLQSNSTVYNQSPAGSTAGSNPSPTLPYKQLTICRGSDGRFYDKHSGKAFLFPLNSKVVTLGSDGKYHDHKTGEIVKVNLNLENFKKLPHVLCLQDNSLNSKQKQSNFKQKNVSKKKLKQVDGPTNAETLLKIRRKLETQQKNKMEKQTSELEEKKKRRLERQKLKLERQIRKQARQGQVIHKTGSKENPKKLEKETRKKQITKKEKKRKSGRPKLSDIEVTSDEEGEVPIESDGEESDVVSEVDSKYEYDTISRRVRMAQSGLLPKVYRRAGDEAWIEGSDWETDYHIEQQTPLLFGRNARLVAQAQNIFPLSRAGVDEELRSSCEVCSKADVPESLLVCDECDRCYHMTCLSPPLYLFPMEEWVCPECEHCELIVKLRKQGLLARSTSKKYRRRRNFLTDLKAPDELTDQMFKVTSANILQGRSGRSTKVNYSDDKYDKLVSQAVKDANSSSSESESEAQGKTKTTDSATAKSKKRSYGSALRTMKKLPSRKCRPKEKSRSRKRQKLTALEINPASSSNESDFSCSGSESSDDSSPPREDIREASKEVESRAELAGGLYMTSSGRTTNSISRVSKFL